MYIPLRRMRAAAVALAFTALSPWMLRAQTVYTYTGGAQSYTVPAGTTLIHIKAWGAGGGAAANVSGAYGAGGGAGFVEADVTVTPGQVFTILVGQGGTGWNGSEGYGGVTYPNGGPPTNFGGGGGGRTEISSSNGVLLIAAGGGGGGYPFNGAGGQGGVGGASVGGAGGSSANNSGGGGGTQSSGGSGGHGDASNGNAGGARQGAAANGANSPPGSGGDGLYGGGSGGGGLTGVNDTAGGGGGGSNYLTGPGVSNTQNLAGSGSSPGNAGDAQRGTSGASWMGNFGYGSGSTVSGDRGGNGKVIITAIPVLPTIAGPFSVSCRQREWQSLQINASGGATSYNASPLPSGVTINTSTGVISGNPDISGSFQTMLTASNANGSDQKTLTWSVAGAVISATPTVPANVQLGNSMSIVAAGTTNFPFDHIENSILRPGTAGWVVLGNTPSNTTLVYTPDAGGGTYYYRCRVVDVFGNYNQTGDYFQFTVTVPAATPPTSFTASSTGSTFVTLNWSGATAGAGVGSYKLYRDGNLIATVTGTTYTDSSVSPSTGYNYSIYTVDTQGNVSGSPATLAVTTARALEVFSPSP